MTDVVSAEWLADRLDEVRIVDVRDAWEYDGIGHLPGAVSIPFDRFRSEEHAAQRDAGGSDGDEPREESKGMLPPIADWESLLSEAGIDSDEEIVAYDDTHGVFAARFLVTAELLGHDPDRLHLLDGDYSAWTREHEVSREAPEVTGADYAVEEPESTPLVGYDAVEDAIGTDTVIVDTRERHEYEEGHIPGAVLLDWREFVDEETRGLKPREELEAILRERGIEPDHHVLLYCNTARRISHTYVVLRHLGYEGLSFYEGSLTEWRERGGSLESGPPEEAETDTPE